MNEHTALKIVREIWKDIDGRSGGDAFLQSCDDGVKREIRQTWKNIILEIANKKAA